MTAHSVVGLQVLHKVVVRHPSTEAILLIVESGAWRLPALAIRDDRHTAEVDHLNLAIEQRFGLRTTVLDSVCRSDRGRAPVVRVHDLETHGADGPLPAGVHWCRRQDLPSDLGSEDAADIALCAARAADRRAAPHDGRDWMRPGWLAQARAWIERAVAAAGEGDVRVVIQRRAWPSSCVLFVQAESGDFYFKAVSRSGARECAVTAYLAQHFPGAVAPVVAVSPERRWLLMKSVEGRKLEDLDSVMAWDGAATAYGRLQADCARRVDDLRALGCPVRSLESLDRGIEALRGDPIASQAGLSLEDLARLRHHCERLSRDGLPATLDHGDLWPGNVLVAPGSCTIIDWEDVALGHPFLGLAPFVVGLGLYQPGLASAATIDRLERCYVAAFTRHDPAADRLRESLRLARPLGLVDMALRCRRQRPSVVQAHPWMDELVPQTLGLARRALDEA